MKIRIVTDVPCNFKKDEAQFAKLDFRGLSKFFEEMEMGSWQKRLQKITPDEQSVGEGQMTMF